MTAASFGHPLDWLLGLLPGLVWLPVHYETATLDSAPLGVSTEPAAATVAAFASPLQPYGEPIATPESAGATSDSQHGAPGDSVMIPGMEPELVQVADRLAYAYVALEKVLLLAPAWPSLIPATAQDSLAEEQAEADWQQYVVPGSSLVPTMVCSPLSVCHVTSDHATVRPLLQVIECPCSSQASIPVCMSSCTCSVTSVAGLERAVDQAC